MFVKVNNRGLILIKYKGFCKSQPQGIDETEYKEGVCKHLHHWQPSSVGKGCHVGIVLLAIASRGWLRGWLAFRLHGSLSVLGSIGISKMEINQGII